MNMIKMNKIIKHTMISVPTNTNARKCFLNIYINSNLLLLELFPFLSVSYKRINKFNNEKPMKLFWRKLFV